MNGYFSVLIADNGTSLRLYSPVDNGEPIMISEVTQYLQMLQIPYNPVEIGKSIDSLGMDGNLTLDVFLSPNKCYPVQEMYSLGVSEDRMQAVCRFFPPSTFGKMMDKTEIVRDLFAKKIAYGIDEKAIDDFIANRRYCTNLIFAKGTPPRNGSDGSIKYFFNTDLNTKPSLNDDGSVDFFHLNTLNHCKAGDVLAEMIPEDIGEPGISVYKEKIPCKEVKKVKFNYSNNVLVSEDKLKLVSGVDGHVMLVDHKVFVSDILQLENVDTSTGNIAYEGSVLITGNVMSNFTVQAKGNIEVKGVVEGAKLISGGDIIIARGVNGMNKGSLKAEGNIISKFIENSNVEAGGTIHTDSILHSTVFSKTEVTVTSKKGFITGGKVSATNCVSARTLGSAMGSDTIVEVGVDPSLKIEFQRIQKEIVDAGTKLKQIEPVLIAMTQKLKNGANLHSDQIKYLQSMAVERQELKQKIMDNQQTMENLQKVIDASNNAQVKITGEVYPGTKIVIADVSMVVKQTEHHCRFIKKQGVVQMTGL